MLWILHFLQSTLKISCPIKLDNGLTLNGRYFIILLILFLYDAKPLQKIAQTIVCRLVFLKCLSGKAMNIS